MPDLYLLASAAFLLGGLALAGRGASLLARRHRAGAGTACLGGVALALLLAMYVFFVGASRACGRENTALATATATR